MKLSEEPLANTHPRHLFDCGQAELNRFFKQYARQAHTKGTAKTYVSIEQTDGRIVGFYSITLTSLPYEKLPDAMRKGLGYHAIPLFTLARLAVDKQFQGQGVGGVLLLKAAARCAAVAEEVGGIGLLIEAKDENIATWYQSFGAVPLKDNPLTLILPFKTALAATSSNG